MAELRRLTEESAQGGGLAGPTADAALDGEVMLVARYVSRA